MGKLSVSKISSIITMIADNSRLKPRLKITKNKYSKN